MSETAVAILIGIVVGASIVWTLGRILAHLRKDS